MSLPEVGLGKRVDLGDKALREGPLEAFAVHQVHRHDTPEAAQQVIEMGLEDLRLISKNEGKITYA